MGSMAFSSCDKNYYYEPVVRTCYPCEILCEPSRRRQKDCEYFCSDYMRDHPDIFSQPAEIFNCDWGHYLDEAIHRCVQCVQNLCDLGAGSYPSGQCADWCEDYEQRTFGTTTTQSRNLDQGHSNLSSLLFMIAIIFMLVWIGFAIWALLKRLNRWMQRKMLTDIEMTKPQTDDGMSTEHTETGLSFPGQGHSCETHLLLPNNDNENTCTGLNLTPGNDNGRLNPDQQRVSSDMAFDNESPLPPRTNLGEIKPTKPKPTIAQDNTSEATFAKVNPQIEFSRMQGSPPTHQLLQVVVSDGTKPRVEIEDEGLRASKEDENQLLSLTLSPFPSSSEDTDIRTNGDASLGPVVDLVAPLSLNPGNGMPVVATRANGPKANIESESERSTAQSVSV